MESFVSPQNALSMEQVAAICGVSQERVRRWIDKKSLLAKRAEGCGLLVRRDDLIDFLVQHNIPIPEAILPFTAKKILFVLSQEAMEDIFMQFVMRFFERLKKEANFIVDYASYGTSLKMKMIVFRPDLVVFGVSGEGKAAATASSLIKNNEGYSSVKIIAITKKDVTENISNYLLSNGVDAIIPRSIELKSLVEKIKNLY